MTSLVQAFSSIIRDDGNPDVTRRRAELQELITVLYPSEIRELQQGLQNRSFVRDFIPELPVEIRIEIATFLDLEDLINFRGVSKQWYNSWTHISICNKLMKKYFRSAFENTYMRLPDETKQLAFMNASNRLQAMQNGQYQSMAILSYEQNKDENSVPIPILDRRYNNGRVAWAVDGGMKVSNLCSGTITSYVMPDRDKVQLWALSESLIVAGTSDKCVIQPFHSSTNENFLPYDTDLLGELDTPDVTLTVCRAKLYAWHLDGGEMQTVRLPSLPTNRISIQGNRVGIVTFKHEVMIWQVAGLSNLSADTRVTQIMVHNPIPDHQSFWDLAVLFHPDSADTLFAINLNCKKVDEDAEVTGNVQWTVQKYVHGKLASTHTMEYPLEGLDYRSGDEPAEVFWLKICKIDDNGIYTIGPVPVDFASRLLDLGCHHHWDRWYRRRGHRHLAHHIIFDVYEERLSTTYYHLPGGQKDQDFIKFVTPQLGVQKESWHLWNRQMFLPILKLLDPVALRDPRDRLPVKKALLMAIKSCDQIADFPTDVRYIGGYGKMMTVWSVQGKFATRDLGMLYCWVGDPHLAQQSISLGATREPEHLSDHEIQGDGTFVILFGEYDFVVWCYDKNIRLHEQD